MNSENQRLVPYVFIKQETMSLKAVYDDRYFFLQKSTNACT